MVTHKSLLAIQYRLFEVVRNHIYSLTGYESEELICYEHEFLRSVDQQPVFVNGHSFRQKLMKSRLILMGDFHSLPANQRCFLNILKFLVGCRNSKSVIVAMECFFKEDQKYIDDYLSKKISADQFYKLIDYQENWGFPWNPVLQILIFARKFKIPIVGINEYSGSTTNRIGLHEKDEIFAQSCVKLLNSRPQAQVLLLAGEYHISANHLPAKVLPRCSDLKLGQNVSLIHYGIDKFYFEILSKKNNNLHGLWSINPGQYILFECPPWGKWLSWLQWQEHKIYGSDCLHCEEKQSDLHCFFESEEILKECWSLFQCYMGEEWQYPDFSRLVKGIAETSSRSDKKKIQSMVYKVQTTEYDPRNKILFLASLSWSSLVHGLGMGLHSEVNETSLLSDLKVASSVMEYLFNPVGWAGLSGELLSESYGGSMSMIPEKIRRYRELLNHFYHQDKLTEELGKIVFVRNGLTLSRYLDNYGEAESVSGTKANTFWSDHKETR